MRSINSSGGNMNMKMKHENGSNPLEVLNNAPPINTGKIFVVENVHTTDRPPIEEEGEENECKKLGDELLKPIATNLNSVYFWSVFYLLIVIGLSAILSVIVTIIPMHNHINSPDYWWEALVPSGVGNGIFLTVNGLLECHMIFNKPFLKSTKTFVSLLSMTVLGSVVPLIICRLTWTEFLGYNHPIPFLGLLGFVFMNAWHFMALWFEFPFEMRTDKDMRKKIIAYMLYRLWFIFHGIQLLGLNMGMGKLSLNWQWIMAVIFPLHREMNSLVLTKLLKITIDYEKTLPFIPEIIVSISINIVHAFFAAVVISTLATRFTAYCILGVEVVLNFYETYKIVKSMRNISPENHCENERRRNERTVESLTLIVIELIEILVPFTYLITFLMAYYGPNAGIIGNIRNSDFHYKEVDDISSLMQDLIGMFVIDLVGFLVTGMIIWKYTSVGMILEGYKILKFFWAIISIKIGGRLFQVLHFAPYNIDNISLIIAKKTLFIIFILSCNFRITAVAL